MINRPSRTPSLLKGLVFADDGWAMTPGSTKRNGKLYRYYVNTASIKIGRDGCTIARVAEATGERYLYLS